MAPVWLQQLVLSCKQLSQAVACASAEWLQELGLARRKLHVL